MEIAEKIKSKLPIEVNDLENNDFESFVESFWYRFESLVPPEIRKERQRKYFTAPFSSNLRKKYEQKINFFLFLNQLKITITTSLLKTKRFEKFFDKNENDTIPKKDRCLFTYEILSRTSYSRYLTEPAIFSGNESDRCIGIERLLAEGIFLAAYPLHEVIISSKLIFIKNITLTVELCPRGIKRRHFLDKNISIKILF